MIVMDGTALGLIIGLTIATALIAYFVWLVKSGQFKSGTFESSVKDATDVFYEKTKKDLNEALNIRNNIDHCPKCGSHDIKIYRKGYNYSTGFWGAIFGVRGAGYAGGFDANNACCRCMNCGKDWETDYDYRLIK